MVLYKNYCYADIQAVADSVQSESVLAGFGLIGSVTPVSSSELNVQYTVADGSINTALLTFPSCTLLGFNNSYTGLTMEQSIELTGLIILVFASVFATKILRRTL